MMKVSVAVVTCNRERFMPAIYEAYARQTFPDSELLVVDDSRRPSPFFASLADSRVRYWHLPKRETIGAKRNFLVQEARGEWICHFDDDDYYAENYVAQMLAYARDVAFVKLSAWFNFSVAPRCLTYWDTGAPDPLSFRQNGAGLWPIGVAPGKDGRQDSRQDSGQDRGDASPFQRHSLYGYGFSYFYRRETGLRYPFGDLYFGEDYPMVDAFVRDGGRINLVADRRGLVLHQLHGGNSSTVAPQYRLPTFLLYDLFPGYRHYETVLAAAEKGRESGLVTRVAGGRLPALREVGDGHFAREHMRAAFPLPELEGGGLFE